MYGDSVYIPGPWTHVPCGKPIRYLYPLTTVLCPYPCGGTLQYYNNRYRMQEYKKIENESKIPLSGWMN